MVKTGYDNFFKNAKKASGGIKPKSQKSEFFTLKEFEESINKGQQKQLSIGGTGSKGPAQKNTHQEKKDMKNHGDFVQRRKRRVSKLSRRMIGFSLIGICAAFGVLIYADGWENWMSRFEISWGATASASGKSANVSDPKSNSESTQSTKNPKGGATNGESSTPKEVTSATSSKGEENPEKSTEKASETASHGVSNEGGELDHLARLGERKKELDLREEELARQEEVLKKQREEFEKRLKELEKVRGNISSILEDRVKVDDAKVESLVQTISTMKPPQAAKMLEDLDESLAVEIVGRMKKKNAAEILNLIKVEKGRILIEKFAGYKRK